MKWSIKRIAHEIWENWRRYAEILGYFAFLILAVSAVILFFKYALGVPA